MCVGHRECKTQTVLPDERGMGFKGLLCAAFDLDPYDPGKRCAGLAEGNALYRFLKERDIRTTRKGWELRSPCS